MENKDMPDVTWVYDTRKFNGWAGSDNFNGYGNGIKFIRADKLAKVRSVLKNNSYIFMAEGIDDIGGTKEALTILDELGVK